jgi:hypothetical protein
VAVIVNLRWAGTLPAALLALAPLPAQIVVKSGGSVTILGSSGEAVPNDAQEAPPAPDAPGADAPKEKPTPRSEKLKKLEYDRRPSAILAAWSTPPKPPEAEKPPEAAKPSAPDEEKKPAEPAAEPADPEAAKKAAAEAEKKKQQEEEAAKKAAEAKAIDAEMKVLQRDVTLGDWAAVKTYFAGLADVEKKAGYDQLLKSLQRGPAQQPQNVPQQGQPYVEKNQFAPEDVLALAAASPVKLEKANLELLGKILRLAIDAGHQIDRFLADLGPALSAEGAVPDRRQMALILVGANEPTYLGDLLPTAEEAEKANDREGLNLLSRFDLAQYDKEKKVEWLEKAWTATQAALAVGEITEDAKREAIQRAVAIAPKIRKDLGQKWLDESFTQRPDRGMEILAAIGTSASTSLAADALDADKRLKLLDLQTTAANALLAASPERADSWKGELALLAGNWLREAIVTHRFDTSTSLGPRMQRDSWGNFFYWNDDWDPEARMRGQNVAPIPTAKILDVRPSDAWLARIDPTLQPRLHMAFAQLLLKVGEEAAAFPHIEELAATHPRPAKDLVDEFLRVWTKNHNLNSDQTRRNPYVYFYGFEERANGIPLTRSKQERNLQELAGWVARLKKLPVEVDVELLANAFTSAHSVAEVYRIETIERIFGSLADLDPATLGEIFQKMRTNLVEVWRDPAVQKDKKTNRRPQDIQAEVLRGYQLANDTIQRSLEAHPDSWQLVLAQGSLAHDENNYRNELKKEPEFSARRDASFALFQQAADLYAKAVAALPQEKETTKIYELWFYAALGACDLKAIDQDKLLASAQIPRIKDALAALPSDRAERHLGMFVNNLFTRMGSANPAVKFRYVREGLAIAGDHKLAREAQKLYDYYKDLVTEIQLRASVDGSDRVGHDKPFGLAVDIRHTKEIERESGGFSKYLQNQNNPQFAYNYGRPLEDYRDKFESAAREALQEHFEVLSVTFNDPQAKSKADPEYGWRLTPYAYLLLKPRGPQVDRVPPLRLDLDFLDTSGYAVIPVESPALAIDAGDSAREGRPYEKLSLTQTLDERQAKDGKLILEVKASAIGLLPELAEIVDLSGADRSGFDVAKTDDRGNSVVKFDEAGTGIDAERVWTLTMRAKSALPALPTSFAFGKPKVETAANEHFRYVDADLASVGETVALEREYGNPSRRWIWWIPAGVVALVGVALGVRRLRRPKVLAEGRFRVPEPVNPFTVLGLLRDIEANDGLAPAQHAELGEDIRAIEHHFFVEQGEEEPDLRGIAETWAERAR